MLLVVDAGNSHTVLGLYDGDSLVGQWRVATGPHRTSDEMQLLWTQLLHYAGFDPDGVNGCCISSVVPPMDGALAQVVRQAFKVDPVMVGPGIKTGLCMRCDNPKEVGADRIANTLGALESYAPPLIIVDFGTATTFDAVSAEREWLGGIIVPGVQLAADALFERCAKLPRVDIVTPPTAIGRNTITNIQSGLSYGYADMVDGLIRRMSAEMVGKPTVVATGGLAQTIASVAAQVDVVDAGLTLKGLKAIYHLNARHVS